MTIDFPEDYRERELLLLIERAKYERYVAGQVSELVERTLNDVLDLMTSRAYRDLTPTQRARLAQLYRELDRVIHEGYTTISDDVTTRMQAYAQLESDVARASVNTVLQAGAAEVRVSFYRLPKVYLQAVAKLPVDGLTTGDWFQAQADGLSVRTRQTIQKGLIEGKGPAEITRRVLAPQRAQIAAAKAAGMPVPPLSRRAVSEAKAVTRTVVNAVQNDATRQSYSQLPRSVSDSYMWMSVLDARTSAICRGLSGRVWKFDDPAAKYPPAHFACRSTTRPLIRGVDVPIAEQKTPPTMNAYDGWLRTQSATIQNDILGPTRAALWREKKMTLADAIDADLRILTLPQLRAKLGLDAVTYSQ